MSTVSQDLQALVVKVRGDVSATRVSRPTEQQFFSRFSYRLVFRVPSGPFFCSKPVY